MDKHLGIVLVASAVIAASIGYSAFNVSTWEQVQIKWNERSSFSFVSFLRGGVIEVCNTSFTPLKFNQLSMVTLYQGEEVARFTTGGATVQPNSMVELAGKTELREGTDRMVSGFIDVGNSGGKMPSLDEGAITVQTSLEANILGVIPITVTSEYTGPEFLDMIEDRSGRYSC